MILTPIAPPHLPDRLAALERGLTAGWTRQVLGRIAGSGDARRAAGAPAARDHGEACAILRRLGMAIRGGAPALDVSWNGSAVRSTTQAYVLLHEGAHFQLASPERRALVDFGLGPGPETGDTAVALRAQRLHGLAREREEALASLLGILWEVELGQPGLASFLDQNWLEGAERPGTAAHFAGVLAALRHGGFIDAAGRPRPHLREMPDDQESALRGPAKWM
jgi:hypothetical protein